MSKEYTGYYWWYLINWHQRYAKKANRRSKLCFITCVVPVG